MATFSTASRSAATVTAGVDAVWEALTDPALLARLTPFLHTVRPAGDEHWVWQMTKVPVLGKSFSFTFRERMDFDPKSRIDFTHDPAPGAGETAGVIGWYALKEHPRGTRLETSMEITVDLPFPGLVRPAVEAGMKGVIALMGQRFSHNLLTHLGATTTRG
ncbi:MAG TPA: SRPBCC family protein [Ornithinibacter sp.]|nr:SRPBCC family protein [Ornithinibacter sp.]